MLHTINQSPFESLVLENSLPFIAENDVILLIENGVTAAKAKTSKSILIEALIKKNQVFALDADLKARGIEDLINGVKTIDYDGFVDLVEQHVVKNWF
ncbi:MAG: sulfurtransferase complex subunit TusB [Methylococcales bacterium]|jgi:tRNA 2-thiouridine synthesizing protein B|nr:sulfurtransferase complex subunit TusB [Methylococcales bacterium]MBT7408349.1 sulfurtransferase complex subunit TusB [Methylococcales bacterium]